MTQDQIELSILRKYTDQYKSAELRTPGSKCERELDMRNVLADITAHSGQELEYDAQFWLDSLAPSTSDLKRPLRRCSDSKVSEREHRWHARAFTTSGSTSAWDRIRELEARLPHPSGHKPKLWKRFRGWFFVVIIGGIVLAVGQDWGVGLFGFRGKATAKKQIASIEFENARPFVDRVVLGNKQRNGYHFQVQICNKSYSSTIRVKHWKLTDLRQLEGGVFRPWADAEPVLLEWGSAQPMEIPPQDKVLVPFARIYPPELQREIDRLLSGDIGTPQLRFTVLPGTWPRRMTSHVPPGTHRFKLTVFFEETPPAEAELELDWKGERRESVEAMAKDINVRMLK